MWSTTAPELIDKPGWTTDPALPTPAVTQQWEAKFTRRLGLGLTPQIGMSAGGHASAGVGLVLTPALSMAAAGRSVAQFALALSPQIGMALPPPIAADVNIALSASVAMSAGEHYARALEIAATPGLGFAAAERYARSFGLTITPQLGLAATTRTPGSFDLGLTPAIGFAGVKAPIRFDNATDGGSGGTTTRSWSHTLNGNCIVVVLASTTNSTPTCTFGGVNIPRVFGPSTDGSYLSIYTSRISVFALVSDSLPQGSQTVSVTQAATASAASAMSFRNAGSIGSVTSDTGTGNISQTTAAGAGRAAVCAYVGGVNNFGALSPNEAMRYGFTAFVTWGCVAGWGLDSGSGITFSATHSFEKTGAIVPILPAT